MAERFAAAELVRFARALLEAAGLEADKALTTAELLVEADLMGHTTHGLQLLSGYLGDLDRGGMGKHGEPVTVVDRGAVIVWDGQRLPGLWLTARALDLALDRAAEHGTATIAIRRSHHIGCLAVYLPRATERGCMAIIASSDPAVATVAPYGGVRARFTPNPIAIGIPTGADPILVDISASITTNGLAHRMHQEGERLRGPWVMDAEGNETDDPGVLFQDPPGTVLPLGGRAYGHKGFGLALMIEALTQGLSGFGRADASEGWGASVFVQVLDPAAFAGADGFTRQTGWLADACRAVPPAPWAERVRLPGDGATARKRQALRDGVALYPGILDGLRPWSEKLAVPMPAAL